MARHLVEDVDRSQGPSHCEGELLRRHVTNLSLLVGDESAGPRQARRSRTLAVTSTSSELQKRWCSRAHKIRWTLHAIKKPHE